MTTLSTIGVYGFSEEEFFGKLKENGIDTFIDIRRRRGVRGHEYSFANSNYLQNKLSSLNIKYMHCIDLAPSLDTRKMQYEIDKATRIAKRKRTELSQEFIDSYTNDVLKVFDFDKFLASLGDAKNVILFCVERNPEACHRSIVTDFIKNKYNDITIHHIL